MTTDTPQGATTAPETPEPPAPDQEPQGGPETGAGDGTDPGKGPSGEARKYRHRAREAEAERDALRDELNTAREQVTAARRQLAETAIDGLIANPETFWRVTGTDVGDYLNDTGAIDHDRLIEAAKAARSTYGLAGTPRPDRSQGAAHTGLSGAPSWADAFGPR